MSVPDLAGSGDVRVLKSTLLGRQPLAAATLADPPESELTKLLRWVVLSLDWGEQHGVTQRVARMLLGDAASAAQARAGLTTDEVNALPSISLIHLL
jgi:hypothetical protein